MNEIVGAAIEILFGAVFVATAWQYVRHRDPLSRDLMFVFGSIAGLYVVSFLRTMLGELPDWLTLLAVAALLAQPLLVLRVCVRTGVARRAVWWGAAAIYAVALLPLFIVRPLEALIALPALIAAVVTEALAAWLLARSGLKRAGAARARLLLAAAASGLFALALVILGLNAAVEALGEVGSAAVRIVGLLSAIAYALAFLPIGWLRRPLHASAGFTFTQDLIDDPEATEIDVWRKLADAARRITGASHTIVVIAHPAGPSSVLAWPPGTATGGLSPGAIAELTDATTARRERTSAAWPSLAAALHVPGDQALLSALALDGRGGERVTVGWVTPRRSLFASDDRELLEILAGRAAVFADRAAMLREQASLNLTLAASNEAIERASAAKSDFLASMSHELRTPLSAIIGFASLMRDEVGEGELVTVPREWVEHIHSSGQHLLSLINDVLDLSKVEAGRLELEPTRFDLSSAVSELVGGMRPLADAKRLTLSAYVPEVSVAADRGRLRQVLYNLVSNAIKFTPHGGRVEIGAEPGDGEIRISVSDTGIGISSEDQERIFDEFSQLGDSATRSEGTGLGLALTRRLVEAHGGRIEVESAPGRGSRFVVVLPHAEEQESRPPEAWAGELPARSDRGGILLIEDDPSAVRLIRTYLEADGHSLRVAHDGDAGLAEARRAPPAAILLDVLLPGKDGWDVLRELKEDPVLGEIPVVVLTVVDERQLAMALGAVDYFLKPVDRDALLARLARYRYLPRAHRDGGRVLVIDDEPAARTMVEAALASAGYEVEHATSGREGIERIRDTDVDFVICDLLMPDLDGFEVVGRLRADSRTRDLPILILTAHQLTQAEKQRLNGHIVGVVSKDESDLRAELKRWIARAMGAAEPGIP
jgi:signal transduction histidine kinase/CheY-like chemotaxis protein